MSLYKNVKDSDAIKEEKEDITAYNKCGWEQVASCFSNGTALPNFGPLAPTDETLCLINPIKDIKILELGCGGGHSLLNLAEKGAAEIWGLDLSAEQVSFADRLLHDHQPKVHLFQSPMEINPGIPTSYFDLVLSIYALSLTCDLSQTFKLAAKYLKPGGCFIFSDEHPVYSCLAYENDRLVFEEPYTCEKFYKNELQKGVRVIVKKRMLSTYLNTLFEAGFHLERFIEGEINYDVAKKKHHNPESWYSVHRAQIMPTTFIVKARKPNIL